MDFTMYSNGEIYQYGNTADSPNLVIIFPVFSDKNTILAIPLQPFPVVKANLPLFIGDKIMYIAYCDIFRMNKEDLTLPIGILDASAMELIIQGFSSAFRGNVLNVIVPSALMIKNQEINFEGNENLRAKVQEPEVTDPIEKRHKYSKDDYLYIESVWRENMEEVIEKYNLKNKQALYRLRHNLRIKYGNGISKEDFNEHISLGEYKD